MNEMNCSRLVCLLLCLFSFLHPANSQTWSWAKTASGGGAAFDSWAIATDNLGNIYAGGIMDLHSAVSDFGSGVTIPPSTSGGFQSFWVKYSSAGVPLWVGATTSGSSNIQNLCTDPSGNLVVFGSFASDSLVIGHFTLHNIYPHASGAAQYFLAKIDPSGTVLWAIADGNINFSYFPISGSMVCRAGGVTTDASGNIYITASFNKPYMNIGTTTLTNADATGSTYDIFVAKYTPSGSPVWAKSIGGAKNDYGLGITVPSSGNVYVTGAYYSPSFSIGSSTLTNPTTVGSFTYPYAYLAKFSSAGTPTWGQGEGGVRGAFGACLAHDIHDNVYMTGGFFDTTISFGSVTLSRTLGSLGVEAAFVVGYSIADVVTWKKCISSANACWGNSIATPCGELWISGCYRDNADVDGHTLAIVPGLDPVFIAGYDLATGVIAYKGLGSGGDDEIGIANDGVGNIFVTSDFQGTSMVVGTDTLIGVGGGSEYFYLAKYSNAHCTLEEPELNMVKKLKVFPNPTKNSVSVITPGVSGSIEIWDFYGRKLVKNKVNSTETVIDVHAIPRGTYFVIWFDDAGFRSTEQLLIE